MKDIPTLSVVIPAYNCESTITQTVESLLCQKCDDMEIIIVNDGSKDGTAGICEKFAAENKKIKYLSKGNTGVSDTRNVGIDNAGGLYVAFLDSDDVWDKNYYDSDLHNSLTDEKTDIFVFSSCFSDMELNIEEYVKVKNQKLVDAGDKAVDMYYHSFCSFIFKKSFLKNNSLYFSNKVRYGEDELFRSQCLYLAHNIIAQDKLSFYYRNNIASATKLNRNYKLYAEQKLEVYYLLKDFFLAYRDDGIINNATTVTYFAIALQLLSESGYGYKKIKALCEKENLPLLVKNNNKLYSVYFKTLDIMKKCNSSPMKFYLTNRFHGIWFNNLVNFKHLIMKLIRR